MRQSSQGNILFGTYPGRLHHRPSEMRKIYVTGLGVISGIGKGVEENLDSLKAGKHGMGKITLFPTALDVPVSEENRAMKN